MEDLPDLYGLTLCRGMRIGDQWGAQNNTDSASLLVYCISERWSGCTGTVDYCTKEAGDSVSDSRKRSKTMEGNDKKTGIQTERVGDRREDKVTNAVDSLKR